MAAASDRAEVDTARPFRSVKEAVAVFGDRILVGHGHSRQHSSSAAAIATPKASTSTTSILAPATATPSTNHEPSSSSSSTMTFSPTPMAAESEVPATVPMMYSAPSSPTTSLASSSPSPVKPPPCRGGRVLSSIQKLEADVAETRQEVARLRKRGNEMEMALASLNAQLHRGLSKLAEMEAAAAMAKTAARRSIGGDTDVAAASSSLMRWGERLAASGEYLPSFSHAMSLGEMDDGDDELVVGVGVGGSCRSSRRRKAQKVKPIVPLISDILFNQRKSTKEKEKGDDGVYSGDLYGVVG